MRVLIAVTHLLGAGHLTRAATLARAFAAAGHQAVLVSGGEPSRLVRLDGVRLVQLPTLHVRGTAFGRLLAADGTKAGAALLEARRRMLLDTLSEFSPDAVMTELFPFGRRALADEFLALVEAAAARRPRPLVLASLRDILVAPDKPRKVGEAHDRIASFYDAVLVHGDPALVALDASWPVDAGLSGKLRYTGYVGEGAAVTAAERNGVLVAAGSSAAGIGLLRAAVGAARSKPGLGWRILAGCGVPERAFQTLCQDLPADVVTRARPNYRTLLARAAVSVSQCGYNTAVDLLAAGPRSVLVPFEAGRETEQRLRAERLATRGLARVLPEAALSPERLLEAVNASLAAPLPGPHGIACDGAARTVTIVERMAAERAVSSSQRRGLRESVMASESKQSRDARRAATGAGLLRFARNDGRRHGVEIASPPALDRLRANLDEAAKRGNGISVWWRDDDAVAATPALDRLLDLTEEHGVPLLVAAIPADVQTSLAERVIATPGAQLAVHGLAHRNHAPPGAKPAEFGPHRPLRVLVAEAAEALRLAKARLPANRLLPVFVPPWNRLDPRLAASLPDLGYTGLSSAPGPDVRGLIRADSHLDPIDWHGTRSLADPDALIDCLTRVVDSEPRRPIGLLTHHLAHDAAIWAFLADLLRLLVAHPAIRILDPREVFRADADAVARPVFPLANRSARAS